MSRALRILAAIAFWLTGCTSDPARDAADAAQAPGAEGSHGPDAGFEAADAGDGAGADAGCVTGRHTSQLAACLGREGPTACLEELGLVWLCDTDDDRLGDDLEAALASAYAPAFAFNSGAHGGNPENAWPTNTTHFLSRARLVFRPDGEPEALVDASPTPASLGAASFERGGQRWHASDPSQGHGPDFWLCLDDLSAESRMETADLMLATLGGVDLEVVAHPANGFLGSSSHLFVGFTLFYAFNAHSVVDDHEGDRETVGVFVDRETGRVDAAVFERHDTADPVKFVSASAGARDPRADVLGLQIDRAADAPHGLRFWDYAGPRRHVVAFVSAGGHAPFDYPGNTRIVPFGPSDTHHGDGEKLLPWRGLLAPAWTEAGARSVRVNVVDPGESSRITLPWARFRGQWGCQNELVAKSWPGPFGNARHPRPVFERAWGSPPAP